MSATSLPLGPVAPGRTAADIVAALRLPAGAGAAPATGPRPRVAAAMISAADGRAAVAGRSVGLGHPADRALLRELRTAVDAILVGPGTLRAERYAHLLDDEQVERRVAHGLAPEPVVATISRSGNVPVEVPLFAEPQARIHVYTEAADARPETRGARVEVHPFASGGATPAAVLEHLATVLGVRSVLCEGGPTLLRALVAAACVDDLLLTLAPLLGGGGAPNVLEGEPLDPPVRLDLRDVHRADGHLFMHYVPAS